jgi:hypothetical protein
VGIRIAYLDVRVSGRFRISSRGIAVVDRLSGLLGILLGLALLGPVRFYVQRSFVGGSVAPGLYGERIGNFLGRLWDVLASVMLWLVGLAFIFGGFVLLIAPHALR